MPHCLTHGVISVPLAHLLTYLSDVQDHLFRFVTVEYEQVLETAFVFCLQMRADNLASSPIEEMMFEELLGNLELPGVFIF